MSLLEIINNNTKIIQRNKYNTIIHQNSPKVNKIWYTQIGW